MKVAFLPLDDRPVTRDAFLALARIAGLDVVTPPRDLLGGPRTPAEIDALWRWVAGPGGEADLLIGSAELMIYGGLVPSRIGHEPLDRCLGLAARFGEARRAAPHRRILLSASNLRLPASADATEEPEYWAEYGPQIFAHSFHSDRYEETRDTVSRETAATAGAVVPPAILADVRARRARNLAVLLALVDLAAEGILDALLVGQDDAAEFGWTRQDLRMVEQAIRDGGASARAWTTFGTDELTVRLLARAVVSARGESSRGESPGIEVVYSHPEGRHLIPRYEGQALDLTVTSHITTTGCRRVASDPDLTLFVNNFPGAQEEAPHQDAYDPGELDEFCAALAASEASGHPCALADVRYSNGADRTLVTRLLAVPRAYGIRAYGGWNTASNTLGLALAQALLVRHDPESGEAPAADRSAAGPGGSNGNRSFMLLRFLDDWAYQAGIRQRLAEEILPGHPGATAANLGAAYRACQAAAKTWLEAEYVPPLAQCFDCRIAIDRVEFPWRRLFHIDLSPRVT